MGWKVGFGAGATHGWVEENGRANQACLIKTPEFRGPIPFGPCGTEHSVSQSHAPVCLPV